MDIMSFGAGLQTVCLASMCLNGDYPKPDHIVFSDTGWETEDTYKYLKDYMTQFKGIIPFHVVTSGNIYKDIMDKSCLFPAIPLYTYNEKGKKAILRRQCTMQYKIRPINLKIREIMGLKRYQHGKEPVNLQIGISLDECDRMKPNRIKWMKNAYPLIELNMTRKDCAEYLKKHNIAVPPKSACVCCPYRSDSFLYKEKQNNTADWKKLIEYEKMINTTSVAEKAPVFLHQQMVAIDKVVFNDRGETFSNECEGYCGI